MITLASYPLSLQFRKPFVTAQGTYQRRQGVIIEVNLPEGHRLRGEVSPLPGFSHESLSDIQRELPHAEAMLRDVVARIVAQPDQDAQWVWDLLGPRWKEVPSLRCAIECIVFKAMAFCRGSSFASLFGSFARPLIPVNGTLPAAGLSDSELTTKIAWWQQQGITTFKLKVAPGTMRENIRVIRWLRSHLPQSIIRLDANRSFAPDAIGGFLEEVAPLGVAFIEEPLQEPNLKALERLMEQSPVAVALDESLRLPEVYDWVRTVRPALGALVWKPALLGSLRPILDSSGWGFGRIPVVISSLFEGADALRSYFLVASAIPGELLPCGLAPEGVFVGDDAWGLKVRDGAIEVDRELCSIFCST